MKIDTSINWKNKPALFINPLKKQQITRLGFTLLVLVGLAVTFKFWTDDVITQATQRYENDAIKAEMATKAHQGKAAAQLWMAVHYPDPQTLDELDNLIEQGNAEAMMIKAQHVYSLDKSLAVSLINQAAQEGHPDAIRYLSDKKSSDISYTEFFKYVFKGGLNE